MNNPRVVAGVLLVLVVVIGLNVREFWPESSPRIIHSSIDEAGLTPPDNLAIVSRAVDASLQSAGAGASRSGAGTGPVRRNPFRYSVPGSSAGAIDATSQSAETAAPRLACTAILLGNGEPSAIVLGRAVAEGDRLDRYRVMRITAAGVTLATGGQETFLPLEQLRSGDGAVGAPVSRGR